MLSSDLDLGSRLRGTIEDVIVGGGGTVTGSIHKADMYVCHHRDGRDYRIASRAGKDVGNLSWLYYLITHNAWTSPLRRLLHYPIARGGLPGFDRYRISLSNYGGEARLYLENLVVAAGGEYTKTLRQDNTHLITARPYSEKCDAAREWNIHMVNHLWLEESYAKWEEQSLTNPRYTHFPPRTNLGEVVGQTQIDPKAMESIFYPVLEEDEMTDDDRVASPMKLKNQNTPSKVPASVVDDGGPHQMAGGIGKSSPNPLAVRGPHATRLKRDMKGPTTPAGVRRSLEGQENHQNSDDVHTPSTTGSRGAKDRAVARIHDLAPDIALYEKEKRRVGGVVRGGKRSKEELVVGAEAGRIKDGQGGRKRSINPESDGDDESDGEGGKVRLEQ